MDTFDQLVHDLDTERLSLSMLSLALRTHYRHSKDIPENVKDLICGDKDDNSIALGHGLIHSSCNLLINSIGYILLTSRMNKEDK